MTKHISKLMIGAAILTVLLTICASVPVTAEPDNSTEDAIDVTQGTDDTSCTNWKWENNELTLNGDISIKRISISLTTGITAYIHVNGTVTVNNSADTEFYISTSGSNCTIDGKGKLISKAGIDMMMNDSDSDERPLLLIKEVTLELTGNQGCGIYCSGIDCKIADCPEVFIEGTTTCEAILIDYGNVAFENTKIQLKTQAMNFIIAFKGIFMDGVPTGSFLTFANYETGVMENFVSGETTHIGHHPSPIFEDFYMDMESHTGGGEEGSADTTSIAIGVGITVLVFAVVAAGIIMAFRN